jgi:glutamate synthase (NADPH/NADH) small chain
MPGSAREVGHAEEEGVDFRWQAQPEALSDVPVEVIAGRPTEVVGTGKVAAVRAVRTRLAQPGDDGRSRPAPIPGSAFELPADLVINALGFSVEDASALTEGQIGMTPHGTVAADGKSMMTAADGVFVVGDARRGPSLVVWAIRDGRDVVVQVERYLTARERNAVAEAS